MSITGPSGPLVSLDRHTGTGRITKVTTGSLEETRSYDPTFGELSSIDVVRAGMPLYSVGYLRDALGRVTTKTESIGAAAATTTTFGYDAAGRLETETVNGGTPATWTFQPNGARTTDVDAQDRVHEYGGVTFTYTAAGERETSTDAAGATAYTWDRLGNLLTIDGPTHDSIEYVYDALNRRIGKKLAGVTTSWLYDGQLRIVAELTDGIVTKQFHYASQSNVPDVMLTIDGNGAIGATYRLVTDQLGSVRMVMNVTTGTPAQQIDYDSWGNATVTLGAASFQPFGFAGGLYDPDTKLVHFGARDYDPKLGAWISKDPARFGGGWNFYEYANSDPVNFIDHTGRYAAGVGLVAIEIGFSLYVGWHLYNSIFPPPPSDPSNQPGSEPLPAPAPIPDPGAGGNNNNRYPLCGGLSGPALSECCQEEAEKQPGTESCAGPYRAGARSSKQAFEECMDDNNGPYFPF